MMARPAKALEVSAQERAQFKPMARSQEPAEQQVEDPQRRLEHLARRNPLAPRTIVGTALLRKVLSDRLALLVGQTQHT
jgi:hypothetical protein